MATQSNKPSRQVSSPTTPMGEESVTPVSSPSGLGGLSTSMFPEPNMKQEVIQRAQVGLLMGANGNNEPQNRTPKRQSPTMATRPKKYALEMWVEIETSAGIHTAPCKLLFAGFCRTGIFYQSPCCSDTFFLVSSFRGMRFLFWGIFVRGLRVETFVRVLRSSRVVF